jgi:cell division septal protein FtsQ
LPRVSRFSVATAVVVALFAGLVYLFAWSSIFSVSTVTVSGAPTPDSQSEVIALVNIAPGEKLARVEPRAIATRIDSIDWVNSVDISRHWLSGHVEIAVTPRVPAAYFNGSTIDSTGKVFLLPGFAGANLPTVSAAHPKIGVAAIALFQSLPETFKSQVTSLSAHDSSSFLLHLTIDGRDLRIAWGKNEKTALKIQVINALIALPENKNIKGIDISAPHAPIVK